MKVVITGGKGYIGARLSLFLGAEGHEVTVVCFREIEEQKGWSDLIYKTIVGDIRDQETIKEISNINADVVIHLISLDHHNSEKDPNYVCEVNIQPTWQLLNACTSKGLSKFIYFSTIHVYGKTQNGYIKERHPGPFNAYALTHYLCEEICNYYNRKTDTDCINIRLSNSYGEPVFADANCWNLVVNDLARSAFNDKKIVLRSDGTQIRDFIHYSDICEGINKLLLSDQKIVNNTMELRSLQTTTTLDLAAKVREVYQKRYNKELPIYINNCELWMGKNKDINYSQIMTNPLVRSQSIEIKKKLWNGIEDLFIYLEGVPK